MAGAVKNSKLRIEKNKKDASTDSDWQQKTLKSINKIPSVEYEDRYNMSDNDTMYDWKFKQLVNEEDRIVKENRLIRQELEENSGRSVNPRSPYYLKSKNLESKLESNNQRSKNIHNQQLELQDQKDIYENFTMAQYKNAMKTDGQGDLLNPLQETPNPDEKPWYKKIFDGKKQTPGGLDPNNLANPLVNPQVGSFGTGSTGVSNPQVGSYGEFEGEGSKNTIEEAAKYTKVPNDIVRPGYKQNEDNDGEDLEAQQEPRYDDFFQKNILHDYDTVTYNFTLSMLSERDTASAQEHILSTNFSGPGFSKWTPSDNKMIIAETGSTVLSIADVQINAVAGPVNNGKRLTGAVDFQINILQPLNASFTDTLVNSAISLGLPDGLKATYLLELKFIGRDPETGEIIDPIPTASRQFLIEIIAVEATVDTRGASYMIRAVRSGDKGLNEKAYKTDRPLQLSNLKTVNSLVDSVMETMNLNELDKLAIEKGVLDEYYIHLDDYTKEIIGYDFLLDTDTLEKASTNLSDSVQLDADTMMFRIPQGTSIDRVLEFGLSHSKKLQKLAKGMDIGNSTDADSSNSEDITNFVKHIFHIKVDTKIITWDVLRNEFAKEYHYTISLFPTLRPEIAPGVWAKATEVAEEKIKALVSGDLGQSKSRPYKALSKRYDYLFTGLNDKVLRFDIKYNNQFFFALHSYRGIYSKLSDDTHAKITKSAETLAKFKEQQNVVRDSWASYLKNKSNNIVKSSDENQQTLNDIDEGASLNTFKAERQKLIELYVDGVKDGTFEGDVVLAEKLKDIDTLAEQRAAVINNVVDKDLQYSTDISATGLDIQQYAETLDQKKIAESIDASKKPFEIMWGAVPNDYRNKFNADGSQPGKGHFDSVIEASLTDFSADLVAMDMDIKGDPFWLESERDPEFTRSASYYEGENYLLFRAITSAGEPDPETGLANPNREGKEQMLNGVYAVVQINNSFTGGQFIQNIKGVKEAFISDISILEQYKEEKPFNPVVEE